MCTPIRPVNQQVKSAFYVPPNPTDLNAPLVSHTEHKQKFFLLVCTKGAHSMLSHNTTTTCYQQTSLLVECCMQVFEHSTNVLVPTCLEMWNKKKSIKMVNRNRMKIWRQHLYACPLLGFSGYQWPLNFSCSATANLSTNSSILCDSNLSPFFTSLFRKNTTAAISLLIFHARFITSLVPL